ncbi:HNH endonuclease family protein [Fictibacillus phosphorivorans]|uniref:HNH endonuclease family protein n=1 Tax=Fictibacillus phosphorivorans TaxID=1221500 RepID=UPI001293F0AD|nr:HNH endonuclease family protein [Fictibacillus phosphorivorans]MQR94496.1 HNH endonuclease [Fictibacillus phosphorivorans]
MLKKSMLCSFIFTLVMSFVVVSSDDNQKAWALPPGTPSKSAAQSQLNALVVKTEGTMTGYSRDLFPHWSSQGGGCDTRQVVLKRDADSFSGNCPITSGSWYSYYDGVTITNPSDLDIDHVVPLAEAWRSGASSWTTDRREAFANDLTGPQLIAVTASSNRSKGDQDPSTWKPTRTASGCGYAKWWIQTKYNWGLNLQSAEKTQLQSMLNTCTY